MKIYDIKYTCSMLEGLVGLVPVVSLQVERIPGRHLLSDSINWLFNFRLESSKDSIENNQSSSIILVDVSKC